MNKLLRRTHPFFIALALVVQLQSFAPMVYAQEATSPTVDQATDSAQQSAIPSAAVTPPDTVTVTPIPTDVSPSNPFSEGNIGTPVSAPDQSLSNLTKSSLGATPVSSSAFIRQKTIVHQLSKRSFRFNEAVGLTVNNAIASDLQILLTDAKGGTVDTAVIDKTTVDTQTTVTVQPLSDTRFRPGKYTLHITDPEGNTTTQDFTWGVLALNFNKSIYAPYETSTIAMAVLDDQGAMVCDAKVSLEIKNSNLQIDDTLSTDNGKITVNPQCTSHQFSLSPDYEASYQLAGEGQYNLTLSAVTKNGSYAISDAIQVVTSVPIDVERESATRIYPPSIYPVIFHIKANRDFSGTVSEFVPADFQINEYATYSAKTYDSTSLTAMSPAMQEAFGASTLSIQQPFSGNVEMTQGFGAKMTDPEEAAYYAKFGLFGHDGLDFAMGTGTPVLATDDGVVILAGDAAYGTTVVIKHPWGNSYYGHLSLLEVKEGDKVKRGQEIALSGNSGHTTGAHLHFGIRPKDPDMNNGYYGKDDPMPFLVSSDSAKNVFALSASSDNAYKVIKWNVDLKQGDTIDLAYSFLAPGVSPQFYTLGPLTFTENGHTVFREARHWQIAADDNGLMTQKRTLYLSSQASAVITTTKAFGTGKPDTWQTIFSPPSSSNVLSIARENRSGVNSIPFTPGQIDSIFATGALPTTPCSETSKSNPCNGWLLDTPVLSTIPAGNWTFTVTTQSNGVFSGTSKLDVCVWRIDVSGGDLVASSGLNVGTTLCVEGATNLQASASLVTQTITYPANQIYFGPNEYLYVEFWQNTSVQAGTNGAQTALEVNAGANDSYVTYGPTLDLLMRHGQWFDANASTTDKRQPFTF